MNGNRDQTRIVLGAFVILIGVLALADNLFQINTRQVIQFWPAVFVLVGAVNISQTRRPGGYWVGGVLIALGLLMTLANLGLISFHLRDWWPLFLIAAGIAMISRGGLRRSLDGAQQRWGTASEAGSDVNVIAVMSGNKQTVVSQDFRQGEATAVMGGVEIDFRQAVIQTEAHLRTFAFWGGIQIKVPTDWSVECRVVSIMGGMEDKTIPPAQAAKRLVIDGFVMMCAVVIKN
jgi:predicted membrane protein